MQANACVGRSVAAAALLWERRQGRGRPGTECPLFQMAGFRDREAARRELRALSGSTDIELETVAAPWVATVRAEGVSAWPGLK